MSDSRTDQIAKLKQTIATLEEQQRTLNVDLSLSLNQMRELLAKLERVEPSESPPIWGARLNERDMFSRKRPNTPPVGCPSWATWRQIEDWGKRGLVVWNNETQQLHWLAAESALKYLERLRAPVEWQADGIAITRTVQHYKSPPAPPPPQSRKKRETIQLPPSAPKKPEYEDVEEECVKLGPTASQGFFAYLQSHEATLREMADEDQKEQDRAWSDVIRFLLQASHEHEAAEVDLATRPLQWTRSQHELRFICDRPPNRATLELTDKRFGWQACIEQSHQFKHESNWIHKLEEAFAWAEKEMLLAEQEQVAPAEEIDEPLPAGTIDLMPFWIDPAALEPEQITYRVTFFIEREPTEFKTMELSFGELLKYKKEYPGPQALARELEIDSAQMPVTQIAPGVGFYEVKSNVTYFKESLAAAQAQATWDRSKIAKSFQEGKIISAYLIDQHI